MVGLTRTLALEWAERGFNVKRIAPGLYPDLAMTGLIVPRDGGLTVCRVPCSQRAVAWNSSCPGLPHASVWFQRVPQ